MYGVTDVGSTVKDPNSEDAVEEAAEDEEKEEKREEVCETVEVYDPEEEPGEPGLVMSAPPPPPSPPPRPSPMGPVLPMKGLGVETMMIFIWPLEFMIEAGRCQGDGTRPPTDSQNRSSMVCWVEKKNRSLKLFFYFLC